MYTQEQLRAELEIGREGFTELMQCLQPHLETFDGGVAYFDGDSGVIVFKSWSEMFEKDGFTVHPVADAGWCDVPFNAMLDIVEILKDMNDE